MIGRLEGNQITDHQDDSKNVLELHRLGEALRINSCLFVIGCTYGLWPIDYRCMDYRAYVYRPIDYEAIDFRPKN